MGAIDLTAIVESVAKAIRVEVSHLCAESSSAPCDVCHAEATNAARVAVTATLRALAPLADDWDARAQRAYRDAQQAIERAENAETTNDAHKHAEKAHGHQSRGDTLATCARELRGVIAP